MIFKDKLIEKNKLLEPEFEKLIQMAIKKQTHDTDLLLIHINGFYHPSLLDFRPQKGGTKLKPYVIGDGQEGLSESAHYRFIHQYRTTNLSEMTFEEYKKEIEYAPDKRELIDSLTQKEEYSIQLEMLIYLKFWEADMVIKKFYQLVRLIHGEDYDWHFKISNLHEIEIVLEQGKILLEIWSGTVLKLRCQTYINVFRKLIKRKLEIPLLILIIHF
jgi:hypothetical protein